MPNHLVLVFRPDVRPIPRNPGVKTGKHPREPARPDASHVGNIVKNQPSHDPTGLRVATPGGEKEGEPPDEE